jgi:rhodanese-related sulfurtransferase
MSVDVWKFAQDNVLLIAVAVASGGMLLWPSLRGGSAGALGVGTLEATQLINRQDAVVLDVRSAEDFAKGHIVDARNVPADEIEKRLSELERLKRKPVIVCCDRGNRSAGVAATLRKSGFEKAFSLERGLDAWRQAGLPLQKE